MGKKICCALLPLFIVAGHALAAKKDKPALLWQRDFSSAINSVAISSDATRIGVATDPILLVRVLTAGRGAVWFLDSSGKRLWEYVYPSGYKLVVRTINGEEKIVECLKRPVDASEELFFGEKTEQPPDSEADLVVIDFNGAPVKREVKPVQSGSKGTTPAGGISTENGRAAFVFSTYKIYSDDPGRPASKYGNGLYDTRTSERLYFFETRYNSTINGVYYFDDRHLFVHIHARSGDELVLFSIPDRRTVWNIPLEMKETDTVLIRVAPDARSFCLGIGRTLSCYKNALVEPAQAGK